MANHNINSQQKNIIRKKRGDKCERCGKPNGVRYIAEDRLQLHHKVPICDGGTSRQSNLILVCQKCHDEEHIKYHLKRLKGIKKTFEELMMSGKYRTGFVH